MNSMRLALAAALLGGALLCWRGSSAAAESVPLVTYRADVRAVSAQLSAEAAQLRHGPKAKLVLPQVHLPPAPLGGAPTFSPSLDEWLQANLGSIRKLKNNQARALRLTALAASLRQLARQPAASVPPANDARASAVAILADSHYKMRGAGPAPEPRLSWWQRVLLWFGRLLDAIFGGVFRSAAAVPLIGQVIAIALLLGLLTAIGYAVYTLVLRSRRRNAAESGLGETLPAALDPESAYGGGVAAANAGRYGEAIALLFQASLAYFHTAGKVDYDAARTAGEYSRLVRRSVAPASPYFDTLARAFTFVAYADLAPTAREWSAAQAAFEALRPLVVT
jgi:hypothetical protein